MAVLFELDPTSEDSTNSPLEIWSTTDYSVTAFNAPAPPLDVQWAGTVDTEGSLPSSRKHQNRTISLTIDVASVTGLRNLQAKVAKIAREGGTAKQTFPNSEVVIWDLHAADTFEPQLDITYYSNTGAFCTVNLSVLGRPYGRGPAITTLSSHTATTKQPNVFTETGIKGDISALGNLRFTNAGTNSKSWVVWGIQSRYYDSASTAALFLEAENATAAAATLDTGPSGASGGGTNKVMLCSNVGTGATKEFTFSGLTHIGSFRAYARVQAPSSNTGIVSVNMGWTPPSSNQTIQNDAVSVTDDAGAAIENPNWVILDLGMVSIQKVRLGTQGWSFSIYVGATVATDDLYVDWITLVPVDEGCGVVQPSVPTTRSLEISDRDVLYELSAGKWVGATSYEGDYLRIPPAGAEARTVRVIVLATSGPVYQGGAVIMANDLDADTSQLVSYTPRYLTIPSP